MSETMTDPDEKPEQEDEQQRDRKAEQKENRKAYMREYMRRRYRQSPSDANHYRKTCRMRQKSDAIADEDVQTYGRYLACALKIKALLEEMPLDLARQLIASQQYEN